MNILENASNPVILLDVYSDSTYTDRCVKGSGIVMVRSGKICLDELGVTIDEIPPLEEVRQIGGASYRFFSPRGGKLLFKREQWVDASSGIVLKAINQTRIIAWIQDVRKPVALRNGR